MGKRVGSAPPLRAKYLRFSIVRFAKSFLPEATFDLLVRSMEFQNLSDALSILRVLVRLIHVTGRKGIGDKKCIERNRLWIAVYAGLEGKKFRILWRVGEIEPFDSG